MLWSLLCPVELSQIGRRDNNNNNTRFVERRGAIASEALADRSSQLARNRREKIVLSLALNNVRESQFRTDVGREFHTDGAAVLKERP